MKEKKDCFQFRADLFLKTLALEMAASLAITVFRRGSFTLSAFAEIGFLTALLFICFGLFRLTRRLQFYSMLSYGIKKLLQAFNLGKFGKDGELLEDYPTYLSTHSNKDPWMECTASGLVFVVISSTIVYVF